LNFLLKICGAIYVVVLNAKLFIINCCDADKSLSYFFVGYRINLRQLYIAIVV